MIRLLRLWRLFGFLDIAWMLRTPGSFAGALVSDIVAVVGSVTAMWLLAERFGAVGLWTREHVLFMLGYGLLVRGLIDTLFGYNVAFISRRIGRGQLDHVLVQPQPMWLTMLTEGFSPVVGVPVVLPAAALLLWSGARLGLPVSAAWLALFALHVVASATVVLAVSFLVGSIAFWAQRAAEEINSSSWQLLTQLSGFPLDGLGPVVLGGLLTLVPIGFVAWYPSRALLGLDPAPLSLLVTPATAVALAAAAAGVFRRGLRHYAHTGSQRYLPWGHRR